MDVGTGAQEWSLSTRHPCSLHDHGAGGVNHRLGASPGASPFSGRSRLALTVKLNKVRSTMSSDRKIGVALDYSASSKYALKWAVENLLRTGDQLIVLVVHKEHSANDNHHQLFGRYGSPLIPVVEAEEPSTQRQYGLKHDEDVHSFLTEAVTIKKATVVFKVYWGDPKENICKSVTDIPLTFLVMGCRGLSALKRTFMGSVSNYVSNSVTCPVTIVKLPPTLPA